MADLEGQLAVVTGASRGIGASIARRLSEQGAEVVLMSRNLDRLQELADVLPGATAVRIDVTDPGSVAAAFSQVGAVDILVNNAGNAETAPFHRTDEALWQRMLDLNLSSAFLCIGQVLPGMRERRSGRIVNIASTAGLKGYAYVTAYCAAKHGLVGLTRSLAAETAKLGITVNAVCPGYTETDMLEGSASRIASATGLSHEAAKARLMADNPQGRFIQPEEVAACVAWLCSADGRSVTGQTIAVDGGEVAL